MKKELQGLEENSVAKINHSEEYARKYQTGKHLTVMAYMDSGSENSHPFTANHLSL